MDNEQETIDRVKQISPDRCRQASTRPMEIMQLHRSCRVVILRSSATDETMVPLFISQILRALRESNLPGSRVQLSFSTIYLWFRIPPLIPGLLPILVFGPEIVFRLSYRLPRIINRVRARIIIFVSLLSTDQKKFVGINRENNISNSSD